MQTIQNIRERERGTELTLGAAFDTYIASRKISEHTLYLYKNAFYSCYETWLELPLRTITSAMIHERRVQLLRCNKSRRALVEGMRLFDCVRAWAVQQEQQSESISIIVLPAVTDACEVTLRRAWIDFKQSRDLKYHTLRNYEKCITGHLQDWLDIPLSRISKDMVEVRHREMTVRGKTIANDVFRRLRSVWRFAQAKYENAAGEPLIKGNPISRLSDIRAWHKMNVRRDVIPARKLSAWFEGVLSLENNTSRDIFLLLLFSGIRSGEARNLKWSDVDLDAGYFVLRSTKNGRDHEVPLTSYTWNLLTKRRRGARNDTDYVFPNRCRKNNSGLQALHKAAKLVTAHSGVEFRPHSLRRTYLTIGDELEIKSEVLKALVNHTSEDVTEGYTVRSIERLRRASQRITDAILHYAGVRLHATTAPKEIAR